MLKFVPVAIAAVAVLFAAAPTAAQEGRIRQGGQNRVIEGRFFGPLDFTVSVYSMDDVLAVDLGDGRPFASLTAREFIARGFVRQVIPNSGGSTSLRIRISSAQPMFDRGTVAVFDRRGVCRDRDRIRLY